MEEAKREDAQCQVLYSLLVFACGKNRPSQWWTVSLWNPSTLSGFKNHRSPVQMRAKGGTAQFSTVSVKAKVRQRPLVKETRLTGQKGKDRPWIARRRYLLGAQREDSYKL